MPTAVFSQVFIALGLCNCPTDYSFQLIDMFLLEGEIVLQRLIVNSLSLSASKIIGIEDEFVRSLLELIIHRTCIAFYRRR
jgi:hypothetical protein